MKALALGLTGLAAFVVFTRGVGPLINTGRPDLSTPTGKEIMMTLLFALTLIVIAMLFRALRG